MVAGNGPFTMLEAAWGLPLGVYDPKPLPVVAVAGGPRTAIIDALRTALLRPPCLLSFSGGRDSSALLALAVDLARREGLTAPIPATNRFVAAPDTAEDEWQDKVLSYLGVSDRVVFNFTDELGLVGPYARPFLAKHGAVWPMNTHMHAAIIHAASGGSVITGFGGDEVGASSGKMHVGQIRARQRLPTVKDLLPLGLWASPPPVRRQVYLRRAHADVADIPWLTPPARLHVARAFGRDNMAEPARWDRLLTRSLWCSRYLRLVIDSFANLGADHDVHVVHPFVEPTTLSAFAAAGGMGGLGYRARVLKMLTGELLPDDVLLRQSKAMFDSPLWTEECTQLAENWDGTGLDPAIVDAERLRADWLNPHGSARAFGLLQWVWCQQNSGSGRSGTAF